MLKMFGGPEMISGEKPQVHMHDMPVNGSIQNKVGQKVELVGTLRSATVEENGGRKTMSLCIDIIDLKGIGLDSSSMSGPESDNYSKVKSKSTSESDDADEALIDEALSVKDKR